MLPAPTLLPALHETTLEQSKAAVSVTILGTVAAVSSKEQRGAYTGCARDDSIKRRLAYITVYNSCITINAALSPCVCATYNLCCFCRLEVVLSGPSISTDIDAQHCDCGGVQKRKRFQAQCVYVTR